MTKITLTLAGRVLALHMRGTTMRAIERKLKGKLSRRTIEFIIYPERRDAQRAKNRANMAKQRADYKQLKQKHG